MGAGRATIHLAANAEVDLAGYRFYRATQSGGPWTEAADLVGTPSSPAQTLTDFPKDGTWYFVVTAYDTSDNESGNSVEVSKTITRPATRLGRSYV